MMKKKSSKKKKQPGRSLSNLSHGKTGESSPKAIDEDTAVFIALSQELKDEGNRLFQKRDYGGAMLKYEKALKLLPRAHIDVAYLRSNMAACYMQMGLSEYPRAINECNLALEVAPKYSKALIKRARCYEGLNRLDLALRDTNNVLKMEPNNLMALEIAERVKASLEERGLTVKDDASIELPPDYVEPPSSAFKAAKKFKEKTQKKKNKGKKASPPQGSNENQVLNSNHEEKTEEKKAEDKLVVEEKIMNVNEEVSKRNVKLVLGEDIRWAQLPINCSLLHLREVIQDRFPSSRAVLIKYRDREGDLVTITSDEELRWAEASAESQGSVRLYVVEVSPEQDPFFGKISVKEGVENHKVEVDSNTLSENGDLVKPKEAEKHPTCIEDWIVDFAQLFKNYVGLDSDEYLDLHELGMKVYSEAMEETVTSEEAQSLFGMAAEKFQEMAALALFNWGNVHMSRARKGIYLNEDDSEDSSLLERIKDTYEFAQVEYKRAKTRYEEALKIKPDFYEAHLALGQNLFERARLSWYFAIGNNVDLENWPSSTEILELYNQAEDSMEKGMQMWEEAEERRLNEISRPSSTKLQIKKLGLEELSGDVSSEEALASQRASSVRKQINLLWGTMLYERSIVEFKLALPVWHECLDVAIEKFELAGASETDIAVMVKSHCSNDSTVEGLGFRIDEIVQAWNEMYEAKRWQSRFPSFRLEPLFRRRIPRLYQALENAQLQ
ncbi:protein PHOX1-like [Punica granatum]|uniref:Protein PHOX1-like n=1 Tax=Punica granatum TaxID=22663 RepID=A0A6P8CM53_PUNGR|nr:protein PHOX1-like [Punica granatum]